MKRLQPGELSAVLGESNEHRGLVERSDRAAKPTLSPLLGAVLAECRRELALLAHVDEGPIDVTRLTSIISATAERLGFEITGFERDEILASLEREQKPFGVLQELVDNHEVSDIVVTNHRLIAAQKGRRNFRTDLAFPSCEAYSAFIERLLLRAGTTCSTKKPVADGVIDGFARIHVVHQSICDEGPYLTIRLNRYSSVTAGDLAETGLAPRPILTYLSKLIGSGQTILISGEVGTGKTTLARALASTIPHEESILVIEDTPEIRLEHPHVRYVTTREENVDGAGRISPSQCIRAGMRMAMNRIIFGEIRDAEAAEAFIDVCTSGHPGLSTLHARSAMEAIARLELFLGRAQRGVERGVLAEQVATAVQVIVSVNVCKGTGRRRIVEVKELSTASEGAIRHRPLFEYAPKGTVPAWDVCTKTSLFREHLETGESPVILRHLDSSIELDPEVLYRETVRPAA